MTEPTIRELRCDICGRTDFETIDELADHECDDRESVLIADGDGQLEVIDAICAYVREDLDPGGWKVYKARRIAAKTEFTPTEIGHYLGRAAGQHGRLEPVDISDREFDVELYTGRGQTPRRWRIERDADVEADQPDRVVADGGREAQR